MTIGTERLSSRRFEMGIDARRLVPSLVLAGYGVFIISLQLRGQLTMYINPSYTVPTLAAGIFLLLFSALRLIPREAVHEHGCDECDSCECHTHEAPTRWWPYAALCVPLLLAAIFPPRGLAAFSALQRGVQVAGMTSLTSGSTVKRVSLSIDTRSFSLQDWADALAADPNPKDYAGKPVLLTGMVLHDPASMPPGYIMVMRYQVTCCIADARAEGLVVRDPSHGALKDQQWVHVVGTMGSATYQGDHMPVVEPKSVTPTKAGNPYMY
jgi:putative membrane protein